MLEYRVDVEILGAEEEGTARTGSVGKCEHYGSQWNRNYLPGTSSISRVPNLHLQGLVPL